jgi:hypothetical protein
MMPTIVDFETFIYDPTRCSNNQDLINNTTCVLILKEPYLSWYNVHRNADIRRLLLEHGVHFGKLS